MLAFPQNWELFIEFRQEIHHVLEQFLTHDMKFCREENVDQHVWKLLYYNVIELLKRYHAQTDDAEMKDMYKTRCLLIIDVGISYFENLLATLEQVYKFRLDDYLGNNAGGSLN